MKFFIYLFFYSNMWPAPAYIQSDNKKNKNELQQNINTLNAKLLYEKQKMKIIMKQWNEEREQWSTQKKFYENQINLLNKLSLS